ncbi:MAG: hypothetical protein IJT43_03890 [Stomatobaculum sp.]|nr:hypothetical protein [Stomatobaculum sp.]
MKKAFLCSALSLALLMSGCGSGTGASSTTAAAQNPPAQTAAAAAAAEQAVEKAADAAEKAAGDAVLTLEQAGDAAAEKADSLTRGLAGAAADKAAAKTVNSQEALMETLSQWSFEFTSGVGAWGTYVEIDKDGTLKGEFSDQNAGEAGEGYDGTLWLCNFTGKVSDAEQIGPDTWKIHFSDLEYDTPSGTEEIEDRLRYAYTDAYGLEVGDTLEVYLPGAAVKDLPEGYLSWIGPLHFSTYFQDRFIDSVPEELPFCGLYNTEGSYGFFSMPRDSDRNLTYLVNRGSFPGMKNVTAEMHEDGTYLYEDMDDSGMHLVRNLCFRTPDDFPSMYSDPEGFCRACASKLVNGEELKEFYSFTSDKEASSLNDYMYSLDGKNSYYAFWDEGSNEDTRDWTARMLQYGDYTYVYGISLSQYDETMAGEARYFLLSSLSFTGKPDRLSMENQEEEGESLTAWVSRDPAKKDNILYEEAVWVFSGDEEAVAKYGLDPADMADDYVIMPGEKGKVSASFSKDAACYIQFPEGDSVRRQRSIPEFLEYLDKHSGSEDRLFMKLILDQDGDVAFIYEPYRP